MQTAKNPKYLNRKETAQLLRVSTRSLDRLVADGELKAIPITKRRIVFKAAAVDAFVDALERRGR